MEQKSRQASSSDDTGEGKSAHFERRRNYRAKIQSDMAALVDTEDNSILYVAEVWYLQDILWDEVLPDAVDEWKEANSLGKNADIPDGVKETLANRFIIVSCVVSIEPDAYEWRKGRS